MARVQPYNTAFELTRIMGHKKASQFFNDPSAANPQAGQLLHPPPALPSSPPDQKLIAAQARAQIDATTSAHQAQLQAQKAQSEAIHLQVKAQSEIALARVKADLDAKLSVLDAHLKAAIDSRKTERTYPPGARKARDGRHYVPDPQRPDKYLLVVSSCLTSLWCPSIINRTFRTSRSSRSTMIRLAMVARSSMHQRNRLGHRRLHRFSRPCLNRS